MKISSRIMTSAAIAVLVTTLGSIAVTFVILRGQQVEQTREVMRSMIVQSETVRENFDRLHTQGAFDLPTMKAALKTTTLRKSELYATIPVVAAWQSITPVAKAAQFSFRTPTSPQIKARNPDIACTEDD